MCNARAFAPASQSEVTRFARGEVVRFAHAICTFGARYICSANAILHRSAKQRYVRLWRTWWKVREHKSPRPYAHAMRSRAEGTYRARGISHANEM